MWEKFIPTDKRNWKKIQRIKDGMENPGKVILTQNGMTIGDIVQYEHKHLTQVRLDGTCEYSTVPYSVWHKNINHKKGRVINIKKEYGEYMVNVEFFEDIGTLSTWKYGRYRHGRWLKENTLITLIKSFDKPHVI